MSDTSKATPLTVNLTTDKWHQLMTGRKLARELATSILIETGYFLVDGERDSARSLKRPQSIRLAKQARQLLNLYEEE